MRAMTWCGWLLCGAMACGVLGLGCSSSSSSPPATYDPPPQTAAADAKETTAKAAPLADRAEVARATTDKLGKRARGCSRRGRRSRRRWRR